MSDRQRALMTMGRRAAARALPLVVMLLAGHTGTAVAAPSATVQVVNAGSQPLYLNATYSTLYGGGKTAGPQVVQPNQIGTYTVTFAPLQLDPGQVWLFRWGTSNTFVGVSAVFGSRNNQDVLCGYTDANAGYDGEQLVPWAAGCDSITQSGTGPETIVGSATVHDPPTRYSPTPCTANHPAWANASDTGVQFNVDNATSLPLNLVWGLVAEDQGDVDPPIPPVDGGGASTWRAAQFDPPLGNNSPLADTWQFSPPQIVAPESNVSNFCAYDLTSAVGGSDTGTFFTVLYQIGTTDAYLKLGAVDPIMGSNQADCEITNLAGQPLSGTGFNADCGIQHGHGIHSVWHAVAWATVWSESEQSRSLAPSRARPSSIAPRPAVAGGEDLPGAARAPRSGRGVVATVGRTRLARTAYRAVWEHRTAIARNAALTRLMTDTTHRDCIRAVAAHAPRGTRDPATRARRFCAPIRRPAPVGRRTARREALNALVLARWVALEARRRSIRVPKARVDRRVALLRRRAGSRFPALLHAARLSRRELRRQVRTVALARQLGLVTTRPANRVRTGRAVRRLYARWRPLTRCQPRLYVRDVCGRRFGRKSGP